MTLPRSVNSRLSVTRSAALLCAFCLITSAGVLAQNSNGATPTIDSAQTLKGHQGASLRVVVVGPDGKPIAQQAVIKLHRGAGDTTYWQTTDEMSGTLFQDLALGSYDLEVSTVGYLTSQRKIEVANVVEPVEEKITLNRDPDVDIADSDASMPSKALQEMHRAIRALNSGDLKQAQKRLEEADKLAPSNAKLKWLFAYVFLERGDLDQAQTTLEQATALSPHYGPALTLLGRVYVMQGDYDKATTTLEQATIASPDNWIAHNLLADAYLARGEYGKAREQAELALSKGDGQATVAQLALGEALVNLDNDPQAAQTLKMFLEQHSKSPAAPHAQELLSKLEQHKSKSQEASFGAIREAAAFSPATDLLPSAHAELPATSWLPPGIDSRRPPVASGASCPTATIIEGAGGRVEDLVQNVAKIASIENITYERRDPAGNPISSDTRQFDYAAAMYQSQPGLVTVDEYRSQRYNMDTLPDRVADNGFAALALVFHPAMRDAFQMTCEGLGEWHGQATWLIRFQQRADRPNHMQAYVLGSVHYPVNLKGRAWITADHFQVVRIESEMMMPMPQIELLAEHVVAEYGPVPFHKRNVEFWLPTTAEVYMYFRGQRYYRKHTFEKYMLFSVDTQEKVNEAKHDPNGPGSTNPPRRRRKIWPS